MSKLTLVFWILSGSILILLGKSSRADVISDDTLPTQSQVIPSNNVRIIEGGTQKGDNLYHSFREFSFSAITSDITGDTVFFNNALGIKNIITRVTGSLPSNIDGVIKANGNTNLFLISPKGIIFGQNASLDIGGSFIATTAEKVKFLDGIEYSAVSPQSASLLTVSVPIGLQFGSNPGDIVNQSQASLNGAVNINGLPAGLQVKNGSTLALIGGTVSLKGGNLTSESGRVELGSVISNGFVNLAQLDTGYALQYAEFPNFTDIELSDGAYIDTSGESGGAIQIQGRNIILTDVSQIISATLGIESGKPLVINATESISLTQGSSIATFALSEGAAGNILATAGESINLIGISADNEFLSGIGSQVFDTATGNGGNLNIQATKLLIRDGAIIDVSTFGAGQAGNISIRTFDSVEVIGTSSDGLITSGIFTQVSNGAIPDTGDAGNLTIETKHLFVLDGGQISSATFTGGKGGNLVINASKFIQLSGTSSQATRNQRRSGLFVSAESGATNDAGELKITTGKLTVENNAEISANNFGSGKGGTATLNVRQLTLRNGGEVRARSFGEGSGGELIVDADEFVEITGSGSIDSQNFPSALSTSSEASGNAGNLFINTPTLNVRNGAEVNVSATGTGAAGNLTTNANTIRLNQAKLTAETNAGEGANITLENLQLLTLQNQSLISAQAFNNANGGNIIIDAKDGFIVATPNQNNDIVANAFQGQGGKIDITARSIFSLAERSSTPANTTNDIDASSEFGLTGSVIINTPDVDPSRGLVQLPENVTDASQQIVSSCNPGNVASRSSFTITGRGGIARSPMEPLQGEVAIARWIKVDTQPQARNISPTPVPAQIVEAQGWVMDDQGNVTLVAQAPTIAPDGSATFSMACGV